MTLVDSHGEDRGGRSSGTVWLYAALVAFVVIVLTILNTSVWMSPQISATVVDAESGKPLSDVIVVANWQLKGRLEGYVRGQLALFETVTDVSGNFTLPAWGPRIHLSDGVVNDDQPVIRVFRRGYLPLILKNGEGFREAHLYIHSKINGDVLSLSPYRGPLESYATQLDPLLRSVSFAKYSTNCEWGDMRRLLKEFDEVKSELHGAANASDFIAIKDVNWNKSCFSDLP